MINDTIVAVSTALGKGAISIVRLSGPEAIEVVNSIFKGPDLTKLDTHTIHYGWIVENDQKIDEVLVSIFRGPRSFTTEDIVEINCHGGIFVTNYILEMILLKGVRLAEPGEFTKRAFVNGRIDLAQAESVIDVIDSKTKGSLKMANYGLSGEVTKLINKFRNEILTTIAQIEVNIDYPEYEDEIEITNQYIEPFVEKMITQIEHILKKAEVSKIIKEGIDTAIIGKPNVGKSSLLNALLREERAIVTNIAGTTRDFVEGSINLGNVVLNLIDTAGIRDTSDVVEQIGVDRSKQIMDQAELLILVFAYNEPLTKEDKQILKLSKDKNTIIVINKKDLDQQIDLEYFDDYLLISSFDDEDIYKLEEKIKKVYNVVEVNDLDSTYIGNTRQIAKLKLAHEALIDARKGISENRPIDIISLDLKRTWILLGEIIGQVSSDDIIDELFSKFCLGK